MYSVFGMIVKASSLQLTDLRTLPCTQLARPTRRAPVSGKKKKEMCLSVIPRGPHSDILVLADDRRFTASLATVVSSPISLIQASPNLFGKIRWPPVDPLAGKLSTTLAE